MDLMGLIKPEYAAIVGILWALGTVVKSIKKIPNNYIPFILTATAILLVCIMTKSIDGISIIQGILCACVSIYGNQIKKQTFDK